MELICPRCGGPAGTFEDSSCPGCWATCKAKWKGETTPCGKPADAPQLLYGKVRVCKRHFGLFMDAALQQATSFLRRVGIPLRPEVARK